MAKIKYVCKNCNWETSIREEWGDLKPKRCMNKRCNTSFVAKPDCLDIQRPQATVEEVVPKKQQQPQKPKKQEAVKADE